MSGKRSGRAGLLAWLPSRYFDYPNGLLRREYDSLSREILHERNIDYARITAERIGEVRDEMDARARSSLDVAHELWR